MRPLPRLFAWTDSALCRAEDFGARAAAIASGGSSVALVVRAPDATAADRLRFTDRAAALARPAEAALFAHGDPALARLTGAAGVQLRLDDLSPADARSVAPAGWIGVSVHDAREAHQATEEGADFVVAGNVFATASHPGRPARGLDWLAGITAVAPRVVAIGGVTSARVARAARDGRLGRGGDLGPLAGERPRAGDDGVPGGVRRMSRSMTLTINGEVRTVPLVETLVELLEHLGLDPRAVVVERNRAIVRRADLPAAAGRPRRRHRDRTFRGRRLTPSIRLSLYPSPPPSP